MQERSASAQGAVTGLRGQSDFCPLRAAPKLLPVHTMDIPAISTLRMEDVPLEPALRFFFNLSINSC